MANDPTPPTGRAGFARRWLCALIVAGMVSVAGPGLRAAMAQSMSFETWLPLAEAGDAEAQCQVGVAYLNGQQVAQDFVKGLAWLVRSSDAGYGYARFVLADVYSRGYAGVLANDEKAYYYASLAVASATLLEKYRDRAVKIRDASAKHLSAAQLARLQAMTAQAPRDALSGS
jgi:uncharacterized protein